MNIVYIDLEKFEQETGLRIDHFNEGHIFEAEFEYLISDKDGSHIIPENNISKDTFEIVYYKTIFSEVGSILDRIVLKCSHGYFESNSGSGHGDSFNRRTRVLPRFCQFKLPFFKFQEITIKREYK